MFKFVFLLQALTYLVIMPSIHDRIDVVYDPPLVAGIAACIALILGMTASSTSFQRVNEPPSVNLHMIEPQGFLLVAFIILALAYCYVSWSNGLINRRQGSEAMAAIFGSLPIVQLAILRAYEIIFVPILILYVFGDRSPFEKFLLVGVLLFTLPFMGLADSRGRLIVLAIGLLCFVRFDHFLRFLYSNIRLYIVGGIVLGVFGYVSYQRAREYASLTQYMYVEIVRRLDGMNLVTELRDFGFIDYWGSFDWNMFGPLISRIPFLEAAQTAKLAGKTSTKQYYLQDLLVTNRLDDSNSMIMDPLYFGGLIGVVIGFFVLGYLISRFDTYIKAGKLLTNRFRLCLSMAFVLSFSIIEVDYLGAFTSFVQNIFVIGFLVLFGTRMVRTEKRADTEQKRKPTRHNARPRINVLVDSR